MKIPLSVKSLVIPSKTPRCRCRIELTWLAYHHKAVRWQTRGQKHRLLYPQCGAHSSQPQLHSLLFFKGSVCVNNQFSTTQAAVEPGLWLQVYFSPEQGVNDHIWEARGSPSMAWGNCPLLGADVPPSHVPLIGKLNHHQFLLGSAR